MDKQELVKSLTELVKERTNNCTLGIRFETEKLDTAIRSKVIRAYIVDLFGNYDEVEGLHELEEAIDESIK